MLKVIGVNEKTINILKHMYQNTMHGHDGSR